MKSQEVYNFKDFSKSEFAILLKKDVVIEKTISIQVTPEEHQFILDTVDAVLEDASHPPKEKLHTQEFKDCPLDVQDVIKSKVKEFTENNKAQFVKLAPVNDMDKVADWGDMSGTSLMKLLGLKSIDKDTLALINPIEHAFLREAILYVAENMSPVEVAEQFTNKRFSDLSKQDQYAIATKFKEFNAQQGSGLAVSEHLDRMRFLPNSNNDCLAKCATLTMPRDGDLGLGACVED